MNQNLHFGHRGRLKAKIKRDPSLVEDHELLEFLLFYSIPRKNTNEEAHLLMNKFGCFRRVFDADQAQLQEVDGIGENTALFLRGISEAISRYSKDAHFITHPLASRADLMEYLCTLFIGESTEKVYALTLSSAGRIINKEVIGNGFAGISELSIKKISSMALKDNAASVVLAHNHPDGLPIASQQDIATTHRIKLILQQIGITLIDHFIVVDNECVSILHNDKPFEEAKAKLKRKRK